MRIGRHAVLVAALVAAPAFAASWEYVPVLAVGGAYETNPNYVSESRFEDDAPSGFVDLAVDLSRETGRSRVSLRPRTRLTGYWSTENASDLNTDDYYLPASYLWTNLRSQFSLNGGWSEISTRDSEIFILDPNTPGTPGSSGRIVSVSEDQERWYLYPQFAYQVTTRDLLSIVLSFDDISYTKAELTGRSNYDYANLTTSWRRSLNQKSSLSANLNVNGFRATSPLSALRNEDLGYGRVETENETLGYGFEAGYEYAWSDRTRVGITAGTSRSDIEITGLSNIDGEPCFDPELNELVLCTLKSNDKNFVGEVFLRQKQGPTITTELSVSRSITPNSDGAQVTQDLARGYLSKEFSARWSGSAGVTYMKQKAVGAKTAGTLADRFDRTYLQGELSTSFRMTPTMFIDAIYSYYSDEQTSGTTFDTINNRITLQFRYQGLGTH